MKILLAIIITAALLAAGYIISALAGFDVFWLLIPLTSLWVAIDSAKLEMSRYKVLTNARPLGIFCVCALLWIFIFPLYLETRWRVKNGIARLKEEPTGGPVRLYLRKMSKAATVTAEWLIVIVYALKLTLFLFLAEECWRGKQMWDRLQQDLAAKGETLDWKAMIPPPVREADNFFSAPKMSQWFANSREKNKNLKELADRLNYTHVTRDVHIAELTLDIGGPTIPSASNNPAMRLDDPRLNRRIMELISSIAGPCAFGVASNHALITRPLNLSQIRPQEIVLHTDKTPTTKELIETLNGQAGNTVSIKAVGSNKYHLYTTFCQAADYLKWSDQFNPEFGLIREGVKRPYARLGGDYRDPITFPIPNYYNYRPVSETLAQRAQCYLLLGQPENALSELTLVHALRRTLEAAPTAKPMSLVAVMSDTAITSMETRAVADGLRLRAWQEPQMITLQKQLEEINLTPYLADSLRNERAFICYVFQSKWSSMVEVKRIPNASFEQKLRAVRPLNIVSGILYLNLINTAKLMQTTMDGVDPAQRTVKPKKVAQFWKEHERYSRYRYPYGILAIIAVPNYTNAFHTLALDQTKADETQLVCALERYRLARSQYPETLNELTPQFIEKLPNDIIGGGPFKYRREAGGQFTLYSVGWDETDSGGCVSPASDDRGDWVWQ
jgi:hypothetical protein